MIVALLGGVSAGQILRVQAVTLASALVAGSLGSTIALWREKTFQALAMTVLVVGLWLAAWEIVAAGVAGRHMARDSRRIVGDRDEPLAGRSGGGATQFCLAPLADRLADPVVLVPGHGVLLSLAAQPRGHVHGAGLESAARSAAAHEPRSERRLGR